MQTATPRPAAAPTAAGAIGAGGAAGKAPPALLPGEHFAAALLFLLLGAAGVATHAADLAGGLFLTPRVAALTHLFTLGWITTSIMGALYQFLPVALDRPIRSVRLAHITFALYVPGLLLFIAGVGLVRHPLLLGGAAVMGIGTLLFIANLGATLRSAVRRDLTWWALALATFYLFVTLALGLALTGNLRWGYLGGGRISSLGVHVHVALAGWVLLVMIGVGHRLLPMFLLSHGAGDRFAKAAVALVAAGAGVLALLHHAPRPISYWLPAILIAAGCAAFLLQARAWYATRHRPALDPGMRLAAAALCLLALAMVLAVPVIIGADRGNGAVAYVAAVILAVSLFVVAHYYRIVPFLVWYHRFGPLAGRRPVPQVHDLYSRRLAAAASAALAAGAAGLVLAIAAGAAGPARAAALLFAGGTAITATQMFLLWRTRP
jgi:hypothetical protein